MSRATPALAALLLVIAGVAPAAVATGTMSAPVQPADDPVVGVSENTSRVLLLTDADAAAFQDASPTVTKALAAGHASLSIEFKREQIDRKLSRVDSEAIEHAILENATDWAAARLAALQERERTARAAFASGDITAAEYVLTLGMIHAEAAKLAAFLDGSSDEGTLYSYARGYSDIRSEVSRISAQTALVRGPVRERVATVVRGDREAIRVHVTTGNGVMLSTIDGDQYVRETIRPGNADPELAEDFSNDIIQKFNTIYPWLDNSSFGPSIFFRGGYAYYYTTNHGHGRISVYMDATTNDVYAEYQWKTLAELPFEIGESTTEGNTTLNVSRTYAGGPLHVATQNRSGAPTDTRIYVNGTLVGSTGSDGELWTISPAGTYNVTAGQSPVSAEVNVTARPVP
ncbi:DUF7096 domain-containing protein [Halobacterium zhouii]|uniref:DUF7096 domain-containing protein n=1 Tax=Halobacterium zhouii TaxID=2902624 RepID=UPI001E637568|nr:hypothetical protein [Halobacterium zhouii]